MGGGLRVCGHVIVIVIKTVIVIVIGIGIGIGVGVGIAIVVVIVIVIRGFRALDLGFWWGKGDAFLLCRAPGPS